MNQFTEYEFIKASDYAKVMGLKYRTVVKHFKQGHIEGFTKHNGRIFIKNPYYKNVLKEECKGKVILYARVSSTINKNSLEGQMERMRNYASAKGYIIVDEYSEIASGLNDQRKKLNSILKRNDFEILISEHKDRLTRFGFNYLETLLSKTNQKIEIINHSNDEDEDIVKDFVSIITSFGGKIYGKKRKNKTNEIIKQLELDNEQKK